MTDHQIDTIQPIAHLTKITSLFLNENKLPSLEGVENMKELKILVVNSNMIRSLKPLGQLSKLTTLEVSWNKLDSFEGLEKENTEDLTHFAGLPNKIAQNEIDRVQNDLRIKVKKAG